MRRSILRPIRALVPILALLLLPSPPLLAVGMVQPGRSVTEEPEAGGAGR